MSARKDVAIQSLRGLAVLLMVAGHVIGSDGARGLQVDDDSLWRLSYVALVDLRMPLFTAISGFVYALRPVRHRDQYPGLVRGKVRRLIIPLLTVGALLFVMQLVAPGVNQRPDPGDAWRLYLYQYQHLWFLQAIFLIFLVVGLLDAAGRLDRIGGWVTALGVACLVHIVLLLPDDANLFSANGALRLLPFFLLGLGLARFRQALDRRAWLAWSLPTFALVYGLRMTFVLTDTDLAAPLARALSLAVGLAGMVSLLLIRETVKTRALAWVGGFAFGIYLLHVFAAAAARTVLQRLGLENTAGLFLLCLAAAVALPIAFELTAGRVPLVSRLILGSRPPTKPEPVPAAA